MIEYKMFRDEAMIRLPKILDFELRQRLLFEVDSKLLYYFLFKKLLTPLSERIHLLAVHLKVEI